MKTLYLLRHAKSSWSDPAPPDLDRPLNDRGRRAASLMGIYMRREGLVPQLILSSTARRTIETLEIIAAALGGEVPTQKLPTLYLADADGVLKVIRKTPAAIDAVLVIGHNPGLHELARLLAGDGPKSVVSELAAKFPTGALAVFKLAARQWSDLAPRCTHLERFVKPRELPGH